MLPAELGRAVSRESWYLSRVVSRPPTSSDPSRQSWTLRRLLRPVLQMTLWISYSRPKDLLVAPSLIRSEDMFETFPFLLLNRLLDGFTVVPMSPFTFALLPTLSDPSLRPPDLK